MNLKPIEWKYYEDDWIYLGYINHYVFADIYKLHRFGNEGFVAFCRFLPAASGLKREKDFKANELEIAKEWVKEHCENFFGGFFECA